MDDKRASFYRRRAAEMRGRAEQTSDLTLRQSLLQLEASWLRLAEEVEKPKPEDKNRPSPRA